MYGLVKFHNNILNIILHVLVTFSLAYILEVVRSLIYSKEIDE